jgi:tartrate-resistant acid phosphatase type 5
MNSIIRITALFALATGITLACHKNNPGPDPTPNNPVDTTSTDTTHYFAVIGDYGYDSQNEAAVANLVKSWNPGFIVTVGDNNYNQGAATTIDKNIGKYYQEFIGNYTGGYGAGSTESRFFPSMGNHDIYTANGQPYRDYFTLPGNERYYSVKKNDVELFIINSNFSEPDGYTPASVQGQWLQQALTSSTAGWKLVVLHHPPYSSGSHGSSTAMQWPYQAWGADAVLAGHDHTYERIMVNGLPYLVNGLGGKTKYSFDAPIAGSVVRYNADYGAMKGRIKGDTLTLSFHTVGGLTVDSLKLAK